MNYLGEHEGAGRIDRPSALLFGNRVAPYHPLTGVEREFRNIFAADFDLKVIDEFSAGVLAEESPRLVIGYEDRWNAALSDESAEAIVRFVETGGGLLLVHNGICWANHPRIGSLAGARFAGHPDQETLRYTPSSQHPAVEGISSFDLREEPYRYDFEQSFSGAVLLHYHDDEGTWVAGWSRAVGSGRIICLQPGHVPEVFQNEHYQTVLIQSGRWCSRIPVADR